MTDNRNEVATAIYLDSMQASNRCADMGSMEEKHHLQLRTPPPNRSTGGLMPRSPELDMLRMRPMT